MVFIKMFWKEILFALVVIGSIIAVYQIGAQSVRDDWKLEKAETALKMTQLQDQLTAAQTNVLIKYVEKVTEIKTKGKETIKYVPQIITKEVDAACNLPNGFVRLHNSAVDASAVESRPDVDAAPSGIELSTATETIVSNYTQCNAQRAQLNALIDVVEAWEKVE